MDTESLIAILSEDLRPVPTNAGGALLRDATVAGAALSAVAFAVCLAPRADLAAAMLGLSFWTKLAYTFSIAGAGWAAVRAVWRPGAAPTNWMSLAAPPVLALIAITIVEWRATPARGMTAFWWGSSWDRCPLWIALLALPIGAGSFFGLARLAPTDARQAGTAAGMLAGGVSASIYALSCAETSPGFVFVWYSLGMGASALIGRRVGPMLLRW